MKLSIAMIVKNEEKYIENTLKPLKKLQNYIDSEIIIVDTGSTDRTVEISKKYTDKIYFNKWNNDFGSMRNISISYCTGDWILIVDADEVLYDIEKLAVIFQSETINNYEFAEINIVNFLESVTTSLKKGAINPMIRIFKKDSIKFSGKIHEQPLIDMSKQALLTDIRFIHYGYNNDDYNLMEYKFKRNLPMLLDDLNNDPENIYTLFQISATYNMHYDSAEALKYIRQAYDMSRAKKYTPFYILQKYCILLYKVKDFEKIEYISKQGISVSPYNLDFHFFLGESLYFKGNYKKAIKAYKKYIEIYEGNIKFDDINAYAVMSKQFKNNVLYNLAICCFKIKLNKDALEFIDKIDDEVIIKDKLHVIFSIIAEYKQFKKLNIFGKYIDKYNYEKILEFFISNIDLKSMKKIPCNFDNEDLNQILYTVRYFKEHNNINENINENIKKTIIKYNKLYPEYVYYILKYDLSQINWLKNYGLDNLEHIFIKISKRYYDFNIILNDFSKDIIDILNDNKLFLKMIALNALLLSGKLPEYNKKSVFLNYLSVKYYYIIKVYNINVIEENQCIINKEDRIILNIKKALEYKYIDSLKYIRALKKLVTQDNIYIEYIKILAENIEEPVSNKTKKLIPQYIKDVESLMINKKYQEAYAHIENVLKIVKFDYDLMESKLSLLVEFNHRKEAFECLNDIILYAPMEKVNKLILENF